MIDNKQSFADIYKAAEEGNAEPHHNLGLVYEDGKKVLSDGTNKLWEGMTVEELKRKLGEPAEIRGGGHRKIIYAYNSSRTLRGGIAYSLLVFIKNGLVTNYKHGTFYHQQWWWPGM